MKTQRKSIVAATLALIAITHQTAFGLVIRPGEHQSDLWIGKTAGSYLGDNNYSPAGTSQQIRVKLTKRGKGKFYFAVQNDGPDVEAIAAKITSLSSFKVKASGKRRNLKPTYYVSGPIRTNVTASLIAGTYTTTPILSRISISFDASIRAVGKAKDRKVKTNFYIESSSDESDMDIVDRAIVKATKKKRR